MRWWASLASVGLLLAGFFALAWLSHGGLGRQEGPGLITGAELSAAVVAVRREAQQESARAVGGPDEKMILFGDFHVHTSVSLDAFLSSLPLSGGEGTHPQADACDFARHCSALDFWSINDHAENLTPRIWRDTVDSIRACNAVAGDAQDPDVVAFLGWEWTQIGYTPDDHWGHRNVVLRHLDDDRIPARPIGASPTRSSDLARYLAEWRAAPRCPAGVPVRDLPRDCMESAATPGALQAKLREWGHEAIVIPHGTAWGTYTPVAASWEKQLASSQHDPALQTLLEVYSGHGNSEEYRSWRGAVREPDGSWSCPGPTKDYTPACWRAGQIIEHRCRDQGGDAADCSQRAAHARDSYLGATEMFRETVVPLASQDEWLDAASRCAGSRWCAFVPRYDPASRWMG